MTNVVVRNDIIGHEVNWKTVSLTDLIYPIIDREHLLRYDISIKSQRYAVNNVKANQPNTILPEFVI